MVRNCAVAERPYGARRMTGRDTDEDAGRAAYGNRRGRRRRRVAIAASTLAIAIVGVAWLSRVPIATGVIDRELAKRGVTAHYEIADLGFGRQRLTNVVIGDPAHPDLVADWVETRTDVTFGGPHLVAVRAGRVRVRGRLVDGGLSLGEIDRLLPASSGAPFSLPALDLNVADGRMRLETPYGVAGLSLTGAGRLDGGFRGHVAVAAERLGQGDCAGARIAGTMAVRSTGALRQGGYGLALDGPLRAASLACGGATVTTPATLLSAKLALGRTTGSSATARIETGAVTHRVARAERVAGTIAFTQRVAGDYAIATDVAASDVRAAAIRAGRVALAGTVRAASGLFGFDGKVRVAEADVARLLPRVGAAAAGTPVRPLADRAARALAVAARRFGGEADLAVARVGQETRLRVRGVTLDAASGARVRLGGAVPFDWRDAGVTSEGDLTVDGGGLPAMMLRIDKPRADAPLAGVARIAPYAAGGARLTLAPVVFSTRGKVTRLATRAMLSGPLADGRVDGLAIPLDLRIGSAGVALNPQCTPLAFERVAVSTLRLDAARLTLCPTGDALVTVAGGRIGGRARVAAPALRGTIGGTPLALAAKGAELRLGDRGFALDGLAARIGAPDRETRIEAAHIDGGMTRDGVGGRFEGAGGQVANVPLLLGDGAGTWEFNGAGLALVGAMGVRDAVTDAPRFQPMVARDVTLGLANGEIGVAGVLFEPTRGVKVADIAIGHRLGPGTGAAAISVPGITFGDGFQPDLLTHLTFGVIADVKGMVKGQGRIVWGPDGVTSNGTFGTDNTDLAAAFGPVQGIATSITFTDLLALESAPNQVATIRSLNPGVPVTDGRITYQTLSGARIKVEQGAWPFAGGALTLEPTLLDFSSPQARRMTFRVDGMDAGQFLQQFEFQNLNATGTFDGVLPMVFDADGGRIEGGRLAARSGGGLAYVGALGEKDLGFWGNFAFQALKSLTYRNLDITMNGPLAGEMVTDVRFAGIRQGKDAKSNFLVRRLTRLPIVFNIRIHAPFRGLIDSAASFYDPQRLVARNLQQLIDEQNRQVEGQAGGASIQPPASDTVPQPKQD